MGIQKTQLSCKCIFFWKCGQCAETGQKKNFIFPQCGIIFCLRMPVNPKMNGPLALAWQASADRIQSRQGKRKNNMECRSSVFSLCGDNLNFKEKLAGNGPTKIARMLSEQGIPTPGTLEYRRTGNTRRYHPGYEWRWRRIRLRISLNVRNIPDAL